MISPYQLGAYNRVCPDKPLFFLPHLIPTTDYETLMKRKAGNKKAICSQIQAENYFFSSTRHFWAGSKARMADNKGNDIIMKAFAEYLRLSGRSTTKLVLVKKGPAVENSQSLARDLGLSGRVVWLDEMPRAELNTYYDGASVCFGQFGTPVVTNAGIEPLCHAAACVSYFGQAIPEVPFYKESPPIMNSKDPHEIGRKVTEWMENPQALLELGFRSWRWAKDNCSEERFVASFLEAFRSA